MFCGFPEDDRPFESRATRQRYESRTKRTSRRCTSGAALEYIDLGLSGSYTRLRCMGVGTPDGETVSQNSIPHPFRSCATRSTGSSPNSTCVANSGARVRATPARCPAHPRPSFFSLLFLFFFPSPFLKNFPRNGLIDGVHAQSDGGSCAAVESWVLARANNFQVNIYSGHSRFEKTARLTASGGNSMTIPSKLPRQFC